MATKGTNQPAFGGVISFSGRSDYQQGGRRSDMDPRQAAASDRSGSLASSEDRLRHYEVTCHVRFVKLDDEAWACLECEEISVGPLAPGMDEDAARQPAPEMLGESA